MGVFRVSNQSQLDSAIIAARGGDTILLSTGTYGKLSLDAARGAHQHVDFTQKVTIASADASRPAVINSMLLRGAHNVEVKNVKLDYNPSKTGGNPFVVENAKKITLNGVDIEGHVSGGFGQGRGLLVKKSQDFTLTNSEISNFMNGMGLSNNTNVTISNNDFRGIANDSIIGGGITGLKILGNDFRAMKSRADLGHKDIIQLYNGPNEPASRDILIRGNVVDNPEETHGIYFGNALARAGNMSAAYRNVVIEDNHFRIAHAHGITVDHGIGVTIRNNTLLQNDDLGHTRMVNIPLINVTNSSNNVTITGNKVASVPDEVNWTWNVSGNVTGTKTVIHYEGSGATLRPSSPAGKTMAAMETEDADAAAAKTSDASERDDGRKHRVDGRAVDGETRFVVEDVDFSRGDVFVFHKFEAGTLSDKKGVNGIDFWDAKGSAKVDSVLDLQELVAMSPDVTATLANGGEDLILRVAQSDGVAEIVFEGLGDEFQAADRPDLF